MCLIIYKDVGEEIKEGWLDNASDSNPDGFGLSYIHPEEGLTTFRTLDYDEFKKEYRRLESSHADSPFILHFRKTTDGTTTVDNCHPFKVGDLSVFHNGMIRECKPKKGDDRSDTRIFCEDVLSNLPEGWFDNEAMLDILEYYIGASKLVVMDEEGTVTFLNESSGHWLGKVWMSNYSYYPNTKSVQKTKPISWNSNKNTTGSKRACYRHPDGIFTKYQDGRRLRWNFASFSWYPVDEKGVRTVSGRAIYQDAPSHMNYEIIPVSYGVDITNLPRALKVIKKESCDWCGDEVHKHFLKAYSWDVDEPVSLLCPKCAKDMEEDSFMDLLTGANIDYYLKLRSDADV